MQRDIGPRFAGAGPLPSRLGGARSRSGSQASVRLRRQEHMGLSGTHVPF